MTLPFWNWVVRFPSLKCSNWTWSAWETTTICIAFKHWPSGGEKLIMVSSFLILSWESFKLGTNLNSDFRPGAANFSPELKQTKLKVLSRSECEAQWGESYNHDIQICTAPSDTHVYIVNISQLFFIPFFLFVSIHFRTFYRATVVVRCCGRNTRRFRALINSIGTRFTLTRQGLSVSQLAELFSADSW